MYPRCGSRYTKEYAPLPQGWAEEEQRQLAIFKMDQRKRLIGDVVLGQNYLELVDARRKDNEALVYTGVYVAGDCGISPVPVFDYHNTLSVLMSEKYTHTPRLRPQAFVKKGKILSAAMIEVCVERFEAACQKIAHEVLEQMQQVA